MSSAIIYTREGCHLCDEAVSALREALPDVAIELIDIEINHELHRRYLERIPVIMVGGETVSELDEFRDGGLTRALEALGRPPDRSTSR